MNNLRRKLQFQVIMGMGGKLKVILPEEFSTFNTNQPFQIYIEKVKGEVVSVYIDSEKSKNFQHFPIKQHKEKCQLMINLWELDVLI